MAIFRVIKDKENPYIMINKYFIYDSKLSLKSKGLMSYFLSRPDDWEFYQNEILNNCTDKKDSLLSAIKELEKAGYIKRELRRDKKGKLLGGYAYEIHEVPVGILNDEKACTKTTERGLSETGKTRNREKPNSENPPLLINDSLLINECSSRKGLQEIINYYCSKALTTELQLKPKEIEAFIKLTQDKVPLELIKQGIDLAFKNFNPSFEGDKIKSFKYCEPVIRGLYAKDLIKKEGAKNAKPSQQDIGEELRNEGIGL
ncbi:helix-turn-helix domain-containing protein [Clostridium tetani]|uniref:Helix-turn-helix domain-containing protein n=1 Tax=Clostridium tetani TaxID=1513 RepID=A0ABC8ED24_CLOTA|nr:replication initiation and membrane attachment [Clostridium tetani]BDR81056.1 hypothetical protein K234311028_13020 [Clostridium tetani]